MMIHLNNKNHKEFFERMNKYEQKRYIELLHDYNITKQNEMTNEFYEECINASLEYINFYLFRNKIII